MGAFLKKGMVYPKPSSKWACASLVLSKLGPALFCFTLDIRPVNCYSLKYQYPMSDLRVEPGKLVGARFFVAFDFSQGCWQLPLHPDGLDTHSFITPNGVYSPTRAMHGSSNATMHIRAEINSLVHSDHLLRDHLIY